jgi:uncharacterized protein
VDDNRGVPESDAARPRRNTRPRDRFGRPLPYGSTGVDAPPEGVTRTPAEALREAQRLLDEGLPFHAHEVLEDTWKSPSTAAAERELWRALAQLAVGITHAERGNAGGAAALLRRAAANLAPWAGAQPHGVPVDDLRAWARSAADAAERDRPLPARPRLVP